MIQQHFPHIVLQIREKLAQYNDPKMQFRRNMIRNVHYLSRLPDEIINEMIACLEVKRFAKDSIIIKSGDVSDRLNFIRHGEIDVVVSNLSSED